MSDIATTWILVAVLLGPALLWLLFDMVRKRWFPVAHRRARQRYARKELARRARIVQDNRERYARLQALAHPTDTDPQEEA